MAKGNNIIVQINAPKDRLFVKVYHDFLYSNLLTADEKIIFIVLKSFLDFSKDKGGIQENTYKSIDDICKITQWGNQKVVKIIKNLAKKGVVKKIRQGLTKPNIYTISDFPAMWTAASEHEMKQAIEQGQAAMDLRKYSDEDLLKEIERRKKEKGLASDTDQSTDTSSISYNLSKDNDSTDTRKNQEEVAERYPLDYLKENLCYNDMFLQNQYDRDMIDTFFHYLHEAMNTTKPTIRVNGEQKPREVVVSVLSKLEYFDFLYAVEKYKENTSKVNNQGAYIITLLYNARAQHEADITNQVQHDMYGQQD